MSPAQPLLFDPALLPAPPAAARPTAEARRRWWRLQGQARRRGRSVEPVLVTPGLMARIEVPDCPVTRAPMGPRGGQVVALRDDASVAAGHLATLGDRAAAVAPGSWHAAWAVAERLAADPGAGTVEGLSSAEWRRLAVLRSFVHALSPSQAATLPLIVLPPPRLRVLSPVQSLQVALTLGMAATEPARSLVRLAALAADGELRDALRVFVLTLIARRPATLDAMAPVDRRRALEDLWTDPLLARRWQRLALRLDDAKAHRLLSLARRQHLLGTGWRLMDADAAVDGWELPGPERGRRVG